MNVTNAQFEAIKNALLLLKSKEAGSKEKKIIKNAFSVMQELQEKKERNNKRMWNYIKEKRKTNKNYARTPYIKKKDRNPQEGK